jgi:hypothetical protein
MWESWQRSPSRYSNAINKHWSFGDMRDSSSLCFPPNAFANVQQGSNLEAMPPERLDPADHDRGAEDRRLEHYAKRGERLIPAGAGLTAA